MGIATTLPKMFRGAQQTGIALGGGTLQIPGNATYLDGFAKLATADATDPQWAQALVRSDADLLRAQQVLNPVLKAVRPPGLTLPSVTSALARQLESLAQLIRSPAVPTRVYNLGLGGWDTHQNQKPTQAALLTQVDQAVQAFLTDLAEDPRGKGTVVLIHSEFGRRVQANGQNGTDHGSASVAFAVGRPVAGGFYGAQPRLDDLDAAGNLKYTTDLRGVYTTLITKILKGDPVPILNGSFPPVPFL